MDKWVLRRGLIASVFGVAVVLGGCSKGPEIEVTPQVITDPFDKAVDAVRSGDLDYIKTCVESEPLYLEAQDGAGRTLLHYAAERGDENIVTYLLEQGAYAIAEDDDGFTPLDVSLGAVAPKSVVDILREATIREASVQ